MWTSLVSGLSHWRFGNVDWGVVARIAIPGGIGGFAGATVLSNLSTDSAKPWMAVLLLLLGIYIITRFLFAQPLVIKIGQRPGTSVLVPLVLFAGFVDATGGGGWGPVATPTLIASGKLDPRKVIGSVSASEFVVTISVSLGFLAALGTSGLDWRVVVGLLAGGVIAAPFAAWLVHKVSLPMLGALVGVLRRRALVRVRDPWGDLGRAAHVRGAQDQGDQGSGGGRGRLGGRSRRCPGGLTAGTGLIVAARCTRLSGW